MERPPARLAGHASRLQPRCVLKIHVWAPAFTGFGGGITTFSRELAQGLRDLGHEVSLVGKGDRRDSLTGIPVRGAKVFPARVRVAAFASIALGRCVADRPDLVICAHLNFGPLARLARRVLGIRYVTVAHGIDVHPGLSRARISALRDAEQLWAVSEWTKSRLRSLPKLARRAVEILPNTFDAERFSPGPVSLDLRGRYALDPDEWVILTVARLDGAEGYKGYDRLVRALPLVRAAIGPVRFIVVGSGDAAAKLLELADQLGVRRDVTLAGFVSDEELADHYRLADVFAMPSTGEGFGIVFLEAMGCGTPVLGGNADGSLDALDGGKLGAVVDPADAGAIANALVGLLRREGPSLWFDRAALHDAVARKFGRPRFRERLRELLREN